MSKMLERVLVRQAGKLDNEYLTKRAQQAEVHTTLQAFSLLKATRLVKELLVCHEQGCHD